MYAFAYISLDFSTKFRVRYNNVSIMWVGDVYKIRNDFVSMAKTKQKKTNFPVKLGGVTIFYAQNNYDVKRFMCTDRYVNLLNWYNYFVATD